MKPQVQRDLIEDRLAPLLTFGYVGAACAALVLLLAHFGNAFLLEGRFGWAFDANYEGTAMTWITVIACATTAVAALIGAVTTQQQQRTSFAVLAAACGFLSLDDAIQVHERLAGKLYKVMGVAQEWDSVIWPALYLPLLLITAWLIIRIARSGSRATLRGVLVGLSLLGAAVVAEVVSAPWSTGENIVHTIEGGIEEALELAGWIVIAAGVMTAVLTQLLREAVPAGAARLDRRSPLDQRE